MKRLPWLRLQIEERCGTAVLKTLLRKLQNHVRGFVHLPPALVRYPLPGRDCLIRDCWLMDAVDYDEGWQLALALHSQFVLDVGANVGISAMHVLLAPNVDQIVLVEANPKALMQAAENLIRNGMADRARFVSSFAADTDGEEILFWTVGTGAAGSRFAAHAVSAAGAGRSFKVSTLTLDTICRRYAIAPDLIKIDTEGAEHQVLLGSSECARSRRARFMVEMHANRELTMADNARRVLQWCQDHGYVAWYLAKAARLDSPQPIQHRGRCHLLLQPAGWPYPEWLQGIRQSASIEEVWERFARK